MLTSVALLEGSGISRATLNNYIALGLLPRPEVRRQAAVPGEAPTTLGYFPDWALERIQQVQELKRAGISMEDIRRQLAGAEEPVKQTAPPPPQPPPVAPVARSLADKPPVVEKRSASATIQASESVQVSVENIPYVAYMVNFEFQLIWLNALAQKEFFAGNQIPERATDRSIVPTLLEWAADLPAQEQANLFNAHLGLIKSRLPRQTFSQNLGDLHDAQRQWLMTCYDQCPEPDNRIQHLVDMMHPDPDIGQCKVLALSFREGVLIVYVPDQQDVHQLLNSISRRDTLIRNLLSQRLPVLTPLAVMVADLQNSVRICSELPPEDYFALINQIWSTLDPIFREYYGAYGKHTGDGMVYYFFPQPDRNYLMNAVLCANKVRETMQSISHDWKVRKGWTNQLYMNIGLSEGEEWLGTFKTNTNFELVVLGETINICGRLSDLARFGKVWATKGLISKLSNTERSTIRYGVERDTPEGKVFVNNSYAQVTTLLSDTEPRHAKLMDIATCAVAEVLPKL
ncbi:adenylate/guanylate cyclase domain-containing protein [Rhodoferax sp.]|uniref:adenylate/guanylate cyclase domain-containing protein n=1 Tax=Rhodoferax sp. TaxID=50421 RepID=UPI002720D3D5|nr:adenylate/guanylate cyclase domain-containing protein [Rhodoferax sp.]MDO9143744.1 adenylate/guanylate cyclase domain-containing protein [Rhodoferax sp.]MDP3863288.1 adenylate/guanylate cyclase domain-containing protein [Rhodoferax sp.]